MQFWASRNGAVQILFLTPTRNMFTEKFLKWLTFLIVLLEYVFYNVEWVKVRKMSEAFWAKLFCKLSDFFANFCWIWDFLAENLKLIDNIQIWGFESFIFWSKFVFFGTVLGLFCQCNFFCRRPTMVTEFFSQPPTIKKLPTAL